MKFEGWKLYRLVFVHEILVMAFPFNKWSEQSFLTVATNSKAQIIINFVDYDIRPGLQYVISVEEVKLCELPLFLHWHRGMVFDQLLSGINPAIGPLYYKGTYI